MAGFTEKELAALEGARLGRLATVGRDGTPHVVPLGFTFNRDLATLDIVGMNLVRSKKWRDVRRTGRAALVVDDLASVEPWRPWGIELRGHAEALEPPEGSPFIRLWPERVVAWGLDTDPFGPPHARDLGD